jgi:hypothetical protein
MGYTIFMFVTRKPGMSLEAFVDHYENKHVPLVLEVLGDVAPVRHTRYYLKRGAAEGNNTPPPLVFVGDAATVDYDCITTVELRDEAHFQAFNEKFATSPRRKDIEEDEAAFADRSKFKIVAVESPKITEP